MTVFVCGNCGKRYNNFDDWSVCCHRFIEEECFKDALKLKSKGEK